MPKLFIKYIFTSFVALRIAMYMCDLSIKIDALSAKKRPPYKFYKLSFELN